MGQLVLHWIMKLNPMTYVVGGLRHYLVVGDEKISLPDPAFWTAGLPVCWWITSVFAVLAFGLAMCIVWRRQKGELQ
jgi:ABC-type polysaccharide/polyol phosphate export permease